MEKYIIDYVKKTKSTYIKINTKKSIKKIYELIKYNKKNIPNTKIEYLYYGHYYQHIMEDYEKMEKYYLME